MQPQDEEPATARGRLSRRSSASVPTRRNTRTPPKPTSCHSTPKKTLNKPENPDFLVTGRKLLKLTDRTQSLPGCRPAARQKAGVSVSKKAGIMDASTTEDELSLDLAQTSDTDTPRPVFTPASASTPHPHSQPGRARRRSLQTFARSDVSMDSSRVGATSSKDSFVSSTTSTYRNARSDDWSPSSGSRGSSDAASPAARSTHSRVSWSSEATQIEPRADGRGEWTRFWASYRGAPVQRYYDQCPTPYRTENIEMADLDFTAEGSRLHSPENMKNINNIIRNEGLHLTPRETQNLIKCAHILGNVLSKAINRGSTSATEEENKVVDLNKETEEEIELKKKMLSLDLREPNKPSAEVEEEKKSNLSATTQTDISLPNTKSAPRIFEKILRQLSKSSMDESFEKAKKNQDEKADVDKNKEKLQESAKEIIADSKNSKQEEQTK